MRAAQHGLVGLCAERPGFDHLLRARRCHPARAQGETGRTGLGQKPGRRFSLRLSEQNHPRHHHAGFVRRAARRRGDDPADFCGRYFSRRRGRFRLAAQRDAHWRGDLHVHYRAPSAAAKGRARHALVRRDFRRGDDFVRRRQPELFWPLARAAERVLVLVCRSRCWRWRARWTT